MKITQCDEYGNCWKSTIADILYHISAVAIVIISVLIVVWIEMLA